MSAANLAEPLRTAVIAASGITTQLVAYKGSFPVFTRRPLPPDITYPVIAISPDISKIDEDGLTDQRPILTRDITVYGQNEDAAKYRVVEDLGYQIHDLFHNRRMAITVSGWNVVDIKARGPIPAPTDDDKTVARMVTLTIRLARKD